MAFKVVATPFGRRASTGYPHEHESLRPLGVEITTVDAATDDEWIAQAKDADAVIVGGRRLTADLINRLEKCKVFASGAVGADTIHPHAPTARGQRGCQPPG